MNYEEAHARARGKGVSRPLYAVVRGAAVPFMRLCWGLRVEGTENVPAEGAAIITPNHKSFFDSFFLAAGTKRHLRFMGKSELFEGRKGKLLIGLGAFPVQRGSADAEALETARVILAQGGLLSLFPEGTRVRDPQELGPPKRGAVRLALETGAPLVPAAITGTEKLFIGPLPRPRTVRVAFGPRIPVDRMPATPEAAGEVLDDRLWPTVEAEFGRLRAHPGLIAAGLAAVGIGAGIAVRRKRSTRKRRWRR
ncbi:MAG: 1-acyl-sn-glycerol-3-phosphate acyltransferase [Actinomycetota bacterium]|nr:1-acyl-sn-glycerol-3-phosphate acyltransferase [Actinomycetota bacterium]